MSEWSPVLAVYWALWALDGARLAARRSFSLVGRGPRRAARVQYERWLLPPFLPASWRLLAADPPLALSPTAVSNLPHGSAGRPADTPAPVHAWRWEDVRHVGVAKGWIYLNGAAFCPDTGHVTAREFLAIASRPRDGREQQIHAIMRRWFRVADLRRRERVLAARTKAVAWCNTATTAIMAALSTYVLADIPASLTESQAIQIARLLPFALGSVLLLHIAGVAMSWRARRRLPVRAPDRRRTALLSAALLPPQALKLRALLGDGYFPVVHPLAAVLAFGRPSSRRTFGFHVLADLRWPVATPSAPSLALDVAAWFAPALEAHVIGALRDAGVETSELLEPPAPDSPASCRYCPRCRDQFAAGPAQCPLGIQLQPLSRK